MVEKNNWKKTCKDLEETGVKFVRVLWCDNANIIRGKAVHVGMLDHYFEHGVGISVGQQGIPVMYDAVVPETGLGPVGEIRLVPDWSSLKPLPYAPGHARVMGNMVLDGSAWPFKLMYSSDAHSIPELYYLGAKWGRQLLGEVLEQVIADSDITVAEAEAIAVAILRENALVLYQSTQEIDTKH